MHACVRVRVRARVLTWARVRARVCLCVCAPLGARRVPDGCPVRAAPPARAGRARFGVRPRARVLVCVPVRARVCLRSLRRARVLAHVLRA